MKERKERIRERKERKRKKRREKERKREKKERQREKRQKKERIREKERETIQSKQCKTLRGPLSTICHPRCISIRVASLSP